MRAYRLIVFAALVLGICQGARGAPESRVQPAAQQESPPQQANTPIMTSTRQTAFTIPFRIEPSQGPAEQPVEVQLHVSTNGGANWELSTRVKPDKAAFVFRAPHDGEYWFCIRTVDKQGVARPEEPLQPQLKVTVDTVAPRLDVSAVVGESGEIVARWQAVDPNLKPGNFKLEYQLNASGPWQRVTVDNPPSAKRHTVTGETRWWPKSASGTVTVRAEITDLAGNPAVNQAIVKLEPGAAGRDVARGAQPGLSPADRGSPGDATRWPADRSTSDPPGRLISPDHHATGPAANTSWRGSTSRDGRGEPGGRVTAQMVGQNYEPRPGSPLDFGMLPPGERPRMVNSRAFELEYDIDSVGPSGISKVELWGTRDGGRHWSTYGIDADNRSPASVRVDGEGVYGFRIVVESGSGLGGQPPAEGELPEVWIGVDLTKPTGRLLGTEIGADVGELVVRWEASDDALDPRPISLSLGTRPQGPGVPIASGFENSGSDPWRLDDRVPGRCYLRLEVRDEAGNVGVFETTEPVALDRRRPEGHIRGVRPVGQAARGKRVG